jgi:hypothetical protein
MSSTVQGGGKRRRLIKFSQFEIDQRTICRSARAFVTAQMRQHLTATVLR